MTTNNIRYDLSDYLIHFFRPLDGTKADTPALPEDWGYAAFVEDFQFSPFFLLRHALRQGRLWATWSIRGGRRTIYGTHPAVCFTEMPLAAFVEAGILRLLAGEAMSFYGLVFPKPEAFDTGARPVIYGLSQNVNIPKGIGCGARVINQNALAFEEQYRYVTYNPSGASPIDWTHEREWRWPYRGKSTVHEDGPTYSDEIPGFNFDKAQMEGMGIIVKSRRQADLLTYDIISKVDRGLISKNQYKFILVIKDITKLSSLRSPSGMKKAINSGIVDLAPYFSMTKQRAQEISDGFFKAVKNHLKTAPKAASGEDGGCWLWLLDNAHELTRSLLISGQIKMNFEGKYLVNLFDSSSQLNLSQKEKITEDFAIKLRKQLKLDCTYFSVLGSHDPDKFPSYNGDYLNHPFYNYCDDKRDY